MQRWLLTRSASATLVGVWLAACSPSGSGVGAPLEPEGIGGAGGAMSPDGMDASTRPSEPGSRGAPASSVALDGGREPPMPPGQMEMADAAPATAAPTDPVRPQPAKDAGATHGPRDAGVGKDAGSALDPELSRRLLALSSRLAPLAARTASFWLEHGPDTTFGGFHGTLDRQGNPSAPDDKGLIQEARQLWMLSTWYERRDASAALAELAARTYDFLRESFVDEADGGFVFKVSRDGSRVVDPKKQLFAESYAIYALSTYGRVFDVSEATELGLRRFESIDASRHDALFGGYDQRGDPGFLTAGAEKDTNTHLHLLEAFTALYEATGDARVAARLNELIDLFATRLLQPAGYVHSEFKLDWTPFGAPRVSYGHDLETAWLLLEGARVLGRRSEPGLRAAALAMAASSAGPGHDGVLGGFFEAGAPGEPASDVDKIWWVQFEAMAGLWWAYELSADPLHLDRLGSTLGWIELTEDSPAGEWFAASNSTGGAAGPDYKGDEWKASYHSVRSLVFVQDWIDELRTGRRP